MPLPIYLMSNFPSVRPSLNLQFDSQPTPEDMTSHLASVGATFSRASIGTYTDANGLIQEATSGQARPNYSTAGVHEGLLIEESRTNLVTSSEDFSTTDWNVQSGITVTINQAIAPDGTASADLVEFGGASQQIYQDFASTTGGVATMYVKGTSGQTIKFGVLGDESIYTLTGGWDRLTKIFAGTSTRITINTYTSVTARTVYVWGAQLEAGSFPTSYIPTIPTFSSRASTATYFDSSGVLQTASIDEARTDHKYIDGQWVEAGLLLEGASTNLVTSSEDFNDTSWSKINSPTITVNDAVAPDGTTTADLLNDPYSGFNARIEDSMSVPDDSNNYCASLFIKKEASEAYTVIQIQFQGGITKNFAIRVRKDTGIFADVGTSFSGAGADAVDLGVEDYDDYWRVYLVGGNNGTGNTTLLFRIFIAVTSANLYTTGSATVWGAQVEQQSQPTSYIPTSGSTATRSADVYTTATKTRSADVCYIDGTAFTDFYNQDAGTILSEFYYNGLETSSSAKLFMFNDGTLNNRILNNMPGNRLFIAKNGFLQADIDGTDISADSNNKSVSAFQVNDAVLYTNGSQVGTDTSLGMPIVSELNIGSDQANSNQLNGAIKKLIYFPRRLTNNELIKLTQ